MSRIQAFRRRPITIRLAVSIAVTIVTSAFVVAQPEPISASDPFLFGATPEAINGRRQDGLAQIENQMGRELGMVRVFERWESYWPSNFHQEVMDGDRLMVVSVRPVRANGSIITWSQIANAAPGSQIYNEIQGWADKMKAVGEPVWFGFHHEPEASGSSSYGNAEQFKAAFRKFVDVFRSRDADNVEFAWIMTHWSFETPESDSRSAAKWYPGDSYVDIIASDAYNWDKCRDSSTDTWRTLEDTIDPQREFGLAHPGKKLLLAEVASTEKPGQWGSAKAGWLNEARELFKKPGWEQFVGVAWFDVIDPGYPNCIWSIDSSSQALAALKTMANDPFYTSGPPATTTTTHPPGTTTTQPPGTTTTQPPGTTTTQPPGTTTTQPPGTTTTQPPGTTTTQPPGTTTTQPPGTTTTTQPPPPTTTTQPPQPGSFQDVLSDHQYFGHIEWLAGWGITQGCNPPSNSHYCPDDPVTRGQMAAFLVRARGYTDAGGGNLFKDDNGSVFEGDIDKLATAGVTLGCNPPINDQYCPDNVVTRGQMAAFLVRAFDLTEGDGANLFKDDNDSVFEKSIDRLATAGITLGCNPPTNTRYCPNKPVTRAEMAVFLYRAKH